MPRRKKTKLKSAYEAASSSPILNQFGQSIPSSRPQASSTMYDASYPWNSPRTRTTYIQNYYNDDYNNNVTSGDWGIILSRARELYANVGAVKNAVCEMTDMAVGDGWYAKYTGPDAAFGEVAQEWLTSWFQVADVRGQPWDFHRDLKLACISTLRDGDALAVLTTDASGNFPRIQWVPAHRIGSRANDVITKGPFRGYPVINGAIISDETGAVIGWNILGNDKSGQDDQQISVVDAQIVADFEYFDQGRGLSALASGIAHWQQYKTIVDFELQGIKHASNFAVQMYVPEENLDDVAGEYSDSPYKTSIVPTGSRALTIEALQGGEVNIWRPDSGAKLEVLNSNRPGPNTAQFLLDHCLRNSFLSLRWPVEMSFDLNSRGATTKLVVAKAQRRIEDLQAHVIYPIWKRIINYAVAKAIKSGILPKSEYWWMWEPTYPRQFVLDNYRDVKADLDMYSKALTTGTKIASSYGYDYIQNLEQKAQELAKADEIAKKYGLNRNELVMQTQQGNAVAAPVDGEVEDSPEDEEEDQNETEQNGNATRNQGD